MSPNASEPRVLALRCRACHAELPAASNDVAFRCPQCGRGWEIEDHRFKERRSLHLAPPPHPTHQLLYLPYWSFPTTVSAKPKGMADLSSLSARDRSTRFQRGYVSAYSIHRPTYIGEWGWNYTRLQPEWEGLGGGGAESPGARISSADARAIVEHYILAEIDRAADIGGLDVEIELGEPELWAIPCYHLGSRISCPWTRAELPVAMLDDLSEMLREPERQEA